MVYGVIMGALTLLSFVIVVYGVGNRDLGFDCNRYHSDECELVFRARACVFAELTWLILVSAWEIKSLRRSMFALDPATSAGSRFPFFKDVYANRFLFFAVVLGAASVFPAVYIPGLNTEVFKHQAITWEWGLAMGSLILFVLGVEAWKAIKRAFGLFGDEEKVRGDVLGLRQGFFTLARSLTGGRLSASATKEKEKFNEGGFDFGTKVEHAV